MRVLLHVLSEVHDLFREDGHNDAGGARVLVVLAPLELSSLPRQLVEVRLCIGKSSKKRKQSMYTN